LPQQQSDADSHSVPPGPATGLGFQKSLLLKNYPGWTQCADGLTVLTLNFAPYYFSLLYFVFLENDRQLRQSVSKALLAISYH
jgi:hypothetical protein